MITKMLAYHFADYEFLNKKQHCERQLYALLFDKKSNGCLYTTQTNTNNRAGSVGMFFSYFISP